MKNRLQDETSPYLKQHENNPVDWYPWGPEALECARAHDKPILLSVGYSACHWCHVMAHECFENEPIAKLMNERFVNIKVDREERPDLDLIYQPVAQLITKGGGWPLTVFLTPDLKPIYGGTYFPPADRYGRPGFPKLLTAISNLFQKDRPEAERRAFEITDIIQRSEDQEFNAPYILDQKPDGEKLKNGVESALRSLLSSVDWTHGGIGSAPKFPNVSALNFLWRASLSSLIREEDRSTAKEAVVFALIQMRRGGIYDQLGGGFSRYSVDAQWSVPHFEKMLYDNALLLKLYSEVYLNAVDLTNAQKTLFLDTILGTLTYLKREMLSTEGTFYTAQDADSEGEEGKFFVWTKRELVEVLTDLELELFSRFYGVTGTGNFENGATVLYSAMLETELSADEFLLLNTARKKVWDVREKRVRPGLDDKILVSWNALALSGISWASLVLEKENRLDEAQEWRKILKIAYAKLKEKPAVFLDDFAFLAAASLDLCRAFPLERHDLLEDTKKWVHEIEKEFADPEELGFYFTSHSHEVLIHRPKSLYDQAIPSGSGVTYGVMAVLVALGKIEYTHKLDSDYLRLEPKLSEHSFGLGEVLTSLTHRLQGEVTVSGDWSFTHRANPLFFGSETISGTTQFCRNQVCVLDPRDL